MGIFTIKIICIPIKFNNLKEVGFFFIFAYFGYFKMCIKNFGSLVKSFDDSPRNYEEILFKLIGPYFISNFMYDVLNNGFV